MQANYTYDNHHSSAAPDDDDPMRNGAPRSRTFAENSDPRTRQTRSATVDNASKTSGNNLASSSGLLQRRNPGSSMEPLRGRSGSVDRNAHLSYTTAWAAGGFHSATTANFPSMDSSSAMEHDWSQYGMSEYDPSAPLHSKDKKKQKEKAKEKNHDADHASVNSRDSGDTGSTHTGNTHLTDNTGQASSSATMFGNGSIDSPAKSDKFSLTKMFQGFRRKHTKNAHSGSALSSFQANNDMLVEDEHEQDDQSDDTQGLESDSPPLPSSGHLSSAYLPHHRKKFESTPNLSSAHFSSEPHEPVLTGLPTTTTTTNGNGAGPDSARSIHDEFDGSPTPSIYAASLFGGDDPREHGANGQGSRPSSTTTTTSTLIAAAAAIAAGTSQNTAVSNLSPKFGAGFLKLRSRSRANSASSKDDLSIPGGDLNTVLGQKTTTATNGASDSASQISIQSDNFDMYAAGTRADDAASFSSLPTIQTDPNHLNSNARGPIIVLQKASPYIGHGEMLPSPYAEGYSGILDAREE
ncbi:hypothetical protein B0O80DRAFT_449954 [Mortierella sp. GBAus27b]|nr:hypothetical protein B0O80DRAFT_449954 [Mortierella sp. GBAus27b]